MKRRGIICLALFLILSVFTYTSANGSDDKGLKEVYDALSKEIGPFRYTLPDDATISFKDSIASYLITWDSIANVRSYQMGVFAVVGIGNTEDYILVAEGWMSASNVKNGKGEEFFITDVIHESILLDGDASKVDIAPQINMLTEWNIEDSASSCYLIVLIIPEMEEPIYQVVSIPLSKFAG